jgi:HlyD family secretion protein
MAMKLSKIFKKPYRKWTLGLLAVAIAAFFGVRAWLAKRSAVPAGIAWGNGRIEARQVDVSSRLPLRVREVLVAEGDLVRPGQVVVRMDTTTLEAELAQAVESVAAAREQIAVARASMTRRVSEIALARTERIRAQHLVADRAGSQRELDVRTMALRSTTAALGEERARFQAAHDQVRVAQARVAEVQSRIHDATLTSPVLGRVLYRLAEPGEVVGPGGRALTLINLEDVYMEIFLPANEAAAIHIGADARFTIDSSPNRVGVGNVTFVSPEAQFTPRQVETRSERERLMFRVRIQVPRELMANYTERVTSGVRGVGYVRVNRSTAWPGFLQHNLVRPREPPPAPAMGGGPSSSDRDR